eukprot:GHVU01186320.1.p2 GENE.GHVU01186320.1~~GHVU01186320.1.p2  ORF type:complete len:290 (-),score=35.65 GHVU01186320.1:906-1775(-)
MRARLSAAWGSDAAEVSVPTHAVPDERRDPPDRHGGLRLKVRYRNMSFLEVVDGPLYRRLHLRPVVKPPVDDEVGGLGEAHALPPDDTLRSVSLFVPAASVDALQRSVHQQHFELGAALVEGLFAEDLAGPELLEAKTRRHAGPVYLNSEAPQREVVPWDVRRAEDMRFCGGGSSSSAGGGCGQEGACTGVNRRHGGNGTATRQTGRQANGQSRVADGQTDVNRTTARLSLTACVRACNTSYPPDLRQHEGRADRRRMEEAAAHPYSDPHRTCSSASGRQPVAGTSLKA